MPWPPFREKDLVVGQQLRTQDQPWSSGFLAAWGHPSIFSSLGRALPGGLAPCEHNPPVAATHMWGTGKCWVGLGGCFSSQPGLDLLFLCLYPRMTRVDLRNYLERIYNVPVAAVRTRVQHGACRAPAALWGGGRGPGAREASSQPPRGAVSGWGTEVLGGHSGCQ